MFSVSLNFPRSYFIIFFEGQLLGFAWWVLEALLEILCCCVLTLVFVGVTKNAIGQTEPCLWYKAWNLVTS